MPKGSVPKREAKKAKKNSKKTALPAVSVEAFTSPDVEVVKKRRKSRDDQE